MFTDLHSLLRNISAVAFISDVLQFCDCLPIMHILAFASFKAVRERKSESKIAADLAFQFTYTVPLFEHSLQLELLWSFVGHPVM